MSFHFLDFIPNGLSSISRTSTTDWEKKRKKRGEKWGSKKKIVKRKKMQKPGSKVRLQFVAQIQKVDTGQNKSRKK